ncbi:MAG: adenylate/guanylate cyclase domain-containing protein [Saprospiraceae bacterium]|nr:adenylate/guanylate cyclase domain-containing protein [Saprospiraceae bacterium]
MIRFVIFIVLIGAIEVLSGQVDLVTISEVQKVYNELVTLEQSNSLPVKERLAKLDFISLYFLLQGDTCRSLTSQIISVLPLNSIGKADSSLSLLLHLERPVRENCDSHVYEKFLSKLANTLILLEDYSRVDSIAKTYKPLLDYDERNIHDYLNLLNNFGEAGFFLRDINRSKSFFRQAINLAKEYDRQDWMQKGLSNLGTCYAASNNLDSAYICFHRATVVGVGVNDRTDQIRDVINLANIALMRAQPREALRLLDSLDYTHDTIENIETRADLNYTKHFAYDELGDYQESVKFLRTYVNAREKILDAKRVTAVADMLEKYEAEKKARQIEELKVENLNSELSKARLARTRNLYMYGGIGILLAALALGNRLVVVRKARKVIQKERDRSDGLLLNILPQDVAEELKATGHASARQVDDVTILFSDFVGFTGISSKMSPSDLVSELNGYFTEFDRIMRELGIEKIKTIGDAYMAAGGLTSNKDKSARLVVNAALKMQAFISRMEEEKKNKDLPYFKMRVGINTGSVVTGVVGDSKFQFDMWGDAVNVASRMESMGEVDRVNISDHTYHLIKDEPDLVFESRGTVTVKGKGEMRMWFVDQREEQATS